MPHCPLGESCHVPGDPGVSTGWFLLHTSLTSGPLPAGAARVIGPKGLGVFPAAGVATESKTQGTRPLLFGGKSRQGSPASRCLAWPGLRCRPQRPSWSAPPHWGLGELGVPGVCVISLGHLSRVQNQSSQLRFLAVARESNVRFWGRPPGVLPVESVKNHNNPPLWDTQLLSPTQKPVLLGDHRGQTLTCIRVQVQGEHVL